MSSGRVDNVAQADMVRFRKYSPSPRLSRFVRNFWTVRCDGEWVAPRPHRVVPDGCIDLVFARRRPTADYQAFVVGTMTRPIIEGLTSHADYFAVRFAPGGFRHFFDAPPGELTDRIIPLDNLSAPSALAEQIANCDDIRVRVSILESELNRRFRREVEDSALTRILETIAACRGDVTMEQLGRIASWSPRHLRRMFRDCVGIGPKTFCRIARFLSALRVLRRSPRSNLLNVALDAGYYD
jgi:AraC-like DNA-binding protein